MDNLNSNIIKLLLIITTVLLISTSQVLAIGINAPYYPTYPLKMYNGETRDVQFTLVSGLNEKTTKAFVNLEKSNGIVKLISPVEYTVEPGTKNNVIIFRITIPQVALIGDTYDVRFSVSSSKPEEKDKTIEIGVGYILNFPINIVDKSELEKVTPTPLPPSQNNQNQNNQNESNSNSYIIGVIVLIAISIIFYFTFKRKSKFK